MLFTAVMTAAELPSCGGDRGWNWQATGHGHLASTGTNSGETKNGKKKETKHLNGN
jgi:hypothetical protein